MTTSKNHQKTSGGLPILLEYAQNQLWLVSYPILERMAAIAENHANAVRIADADLLAITSARDQRAAAVAEKTEKLELSGDTAIIHVDGVIAKYSRLVNGSSQPRGTSIESLHERLDEAMEDPRVKSIFLRIESPGGSGAGLADFADRIYEATESKPVIAFADDLAASAAYWIGSQASRFYANQSAFVGSIGVYSVIVDSSAAAENEGYKVHIVRSGANKGVGVDGVAVTEGNLAYVQGLIDESYEEFIAAVMRGRGGRGLDEETLRAIADGRVVKAAEAKAAGLIDGIMTIGQAFNSARPNPRKAAAAKTSKTSRNQAASAAAGEKKSETKEHQMSTKTETKKTDGDQAADAVETAARAAERKRITELNAALGGDEALAATLATAIENGMSLTEAKAAGFDALVEARAADIAAKNAEIAGLNKRLETIAGAGEDDLDAPESPDESASADEDDGRAETYEAAVEAAVAAGATLGRAHRDAAVNHPRSHDAWVDRDTDARRAAAKR